PPLKSPPMRRPTTPPAPAIPPVTCQLILIGVDQSNAYLRGTALQSRIIQQADVKCLGGGSGGAATTTTAAAVQPVNVTVGSHLMAFAAKWTGVTVSQKASGADDDWGLTFNNVLYLRLRDSVVRDLPYSSRSTLLQCSNCSRFELLNVTLTKLRPAPNNTKPSILFYGPLHATNVSYVSLTNFNCSDVRDAHGWGCVFLQYNTRNVSASAPPALSVVGSSFQGNSITRRGLYGTVHSLKIETASRPVGLGMVVVGPFDPVPLPSTAPLDIFLSGVQAIENSGGFGTLLSVMSNMTMGSMSIVASQFLDNIADASGAAISLMSLVKIIKINATQFEGNTAIYGDGGALFLANGTSVLSIAAKSSFVKNIVEAGHGGAIHAVSGVQVMHLASASYFDENSAAFGNGGAISVDALGALNVTGRSYMSRNVARNGGALYIGGGPTSSITLENGSEFSSNYVTEYGGAVAVAAGRLGQISITGSSALLYNEAQTGGGAIAVLSGDVGRIRLADNSKIAECRTNPSGDGGAVLVAAGNLLHIEVMNGSEVRDNVAVGGSGGAFAAYGNMRAISVIVNGSSSLSGNVAGMHGGVAAFTVPYGIVRLDGANVSGNVATSGNGGAFYLRPPARTDLHRLGETFSVVLVNITLTDNRAGGSGGAIFMAPLPPPPPSKPVGLGPATTRVGEIINADLYLIAVANSTVQRNMAGGAGGAVLATASETSGLRVHFANCTFDANRAGDMALAAAATEEVLTNELVDPGLGGVVAVAGLMDDIQLWPSINAAAQATLSPSSYEPISTASRSCYLAISNSVFTNSSASANGGVLHLTTCTASVDRSLFTNNTAGQSAGAIAMSSLGIPTSTIPEGPAASWWHSLLVRNSTFIGNRARDGGAISTVTSGMVGLYGSVFDSNVALGVHGGAVSARSPLSMSFGHALEISSCRLTSNFAYAYGGAVFTGVMNVVRISNSSFVSNAAQDSGGGFALVMENKDDIARLIHLEISNTEMLRNTATRDGGALYLAAAMLPPAVLHGLTARNNTAARGGVLSMIPPYSWEWMPSVLIFEEYAGDMDFYTREGSVDITGLSEYDHDDGKSLNP
ncbi:hypothetical protein Vretimale_15480, partial [Volvox reticuliferus]